MEPNWDSIAMFDYQRVRLTNFNRGLEFGRLWRRTAPFKPSFPEAVVHRVAIPKTVYTHKHYGIHALNYSKL